MVLNYAQCFVVDKLRDISVFASHDESQQLARRRSGRGILAVFI
jgi:hypothetical protein